MITDDPVHGARPRRRVARPPGDDEPFPIPSPGRSRWRFPVYGTVTPLPNGWLQLIGSNKVIPIGLTTHAVFGGGVHPVNGQFYATLTYVGSATFPEASAGKSILYGREVDVATFVLPLTVVSR
jgi:hypothetical protein